MKAMFKQALYRVLAWILQVSAQWGRVSVGRKTVQTFGTMSTGIYLGMIAVAFFWCYTLPRKREDGSIASHPQRTLWNMGFLLMLLMLCPGAAHLLYGNYPADAWQMGVLFPTALFVGAGGVMLFRLHTKTQNTQRQSAHVISFLLLAVILLVANVSQPVHFTLENFAMTTNRYKISEDTFAMAQISEGRVVVLPGRQTAEMGELDIGNVQISMLGNILDDSSYKDVLKFSAGRCDLLALSAECVEASGLTLEELDAYALSIGFADPAETGSLRVYEWRPDEESAENE